MEEIEIENQKIFWLDGFEGEAKGGIFFRSFDLNQFIRSIEEEGDEVVGIEIDGNNLQIITNNNTLYQKIR
jgi:hypothetical protein